MTDQGDRLTINANVEITAASLQTMVENIKKNVGADAKGIYRVDTADEVSNIISRFLFENNFDEYVKDIKNYK